ncbi:MAG: hypothetical protein BAJALOKI1v1_2560002 [Promethearchaeota archaeon]|nr:MAG: hypothetical protein BAJALOKI1v1_2560002 [Candidatus Lokiarchaeota archaeon]
MSKSQKRADEVDVLIDLILKEELEERGWKITSTFPIFSKDKTTVQIYIKKEYKNEEDE